MSLSTVIEKIQKLRRLATSANVNEAAAAAAAADRLIQQHGLEEAQLQADGQAPGEVAVEDRDPLCEWRGWVPQWQLSLACLLSQHYDCASYRYRNIGRTEFRIVGRPSDVQTMRYMYAWLTLEIERLAQADRNGSGTSYRNSFRHGAVHGVMLAMRESKKVAQAEASSAAMVLVKSRYAEARAALAKAVPTLRSGGRIGGPSDARGFGRGIEAGKGLHGRQGSALTGGTRALGSGS
jgi:hypothetical protein